MSISRDGRILIAGTRDRSGSELFALDTDRLEVLHRIEVEKDFVFGEMVLSSDGSLALASCHDTYAFKKHVYRRCT
jgi:hypothetical protein